MALKYIEKETAAENVVTKTNIMDICWYHCSMDTFKIVGTVINDFYLNLKLNLKMKPCLNIMQESRLLYLFDDS